MNTVFTDFNARVKEIDDYFLFLENLIQGQIKLAIIDEKSQYQIKSIESGISKTLKANCFLLLYNLVESTMRNAIEAIFDEFHSQKVCFDRIKPNLKIIVLQNLKDCFKNSSAKNLSLKMSKISFDIIIATFEREKIFSGNVDAKVIRETAQRYGFSDETDHQKTKKGQNLLVVRENRNDLAHGVKSFEDVGRDKTIEELIEIKNEVVEYLRQILKKYSFLLRESRISRYFYRNKIKLANEEHTII